MVQTLSANGANDAFDECILPGGSERGPDFADPHNFELATEFASVDLIVIPQQIPGRAVEGNASTICCDVHLAVGCAVTLK